MLSIQSYGPHVGVCLPCDLLDAAVSGPGCGCKDRARTGAVSMDTITQSQWFLPAAIGAVAIGAYYFFFRK